jgi:serine/threonine protein kinase
MPGISHLEYTDAFLYQPPEQLQHPEGYLEEAGYRWDVYAFATLSFRLLTGHFPRCDETFSKVAPAFGDNKREGIVADTQKIALGLAADSVLPWPTAAASAREQQYRDLLMQCLHLSAHERPASMAEVSRQFEEIDFRHDAEEHRDQLLNQCRRSSRRASVLTVMSGLLLACAILLGVNWQRIKLLLSEEKSARTTEVAGLKKTSDDALEQKALAEKQAAL